MKGKTKLFNFKNIFLIG